MTEIIKRRSAVGGRFVPVAIIFGPPAVLPSFAAWQDMRVRCESCAYARSNPPSLACKHPKALVSERRIGGGLVSCIEARDPGKACGPGALLWHPVLMQVKMQVPAC